MLFEKSQKFCSEYSNSIHTPILKDPRPHSQSIFWCISKFSTSSNVPTSSLYIYMIEFLLKVSHTTYLISNDKPSPFTCYDSTW